MSNDLSPIVPEIVPAPDIEPGLPEARRIVAAINAQTGDSTQFHVVPGGAVHRLVKDILDDVRNEAVQHYIETQQADQ